MMTASDAARLANDPSRPSKVYEWTYPEGAPVRKVPMSEVRSTLNALRQDYEALRAREDCSVVSDEVLRERLMESTPAFRAFNTTHPKLLMMVTSADFTGRRAEQVMQLIELREQHITQNVSKSRASDEVSQYFNTNFSRKATEEELKEAHENTLDAKEQKQKKKNHKQIKM